MYSPRIYISREPRIHEELSRDRLRKFIPKYSSFVVILIFSRRGAGAFSMDFTRLMPLQCRAFIRALQTEKIKPSYSPVPWGWFQMTGA